MRFAFVALLAVALAGTAAAQDYAPCSASKTFPTISGGVATLGCNGYSDNVDVFWSVSSPNAMLVSFSQFNLENGPDTVTLTYLSGGQNVTKSFTGSTGLDSQVLVSGPNNITIHFHSDQSVEGTGFSMSVGPAPTIQKLANGVTFDTSASQSGGFVYFSLAGEQLGAALNASMRVFSYSGIKPPSLFIAKGRLPTLANYDYTNTTTHDGVDEVSYVVVNRPQDGDYYLAVKLYGTTSHIAVNANWTYSVPTMQNGVNVEDSVSASTSTYLQLTVPKDTASLQIQASRTVPGGVYDLLIGEGDIPTSRTAIWSTEISPSHDFDSLTIPNPNPSANSTTGLYILAIQCKAGNSCGYVVQASWPTMNGRRLIRSLVSTKTM